MKSVEFEVSGMTCEHCENFVRNLILCQVGVHEATVDLATGKTQVIIDSMITLEDLKILINKTSSYKTT